MDRAIASGKEHRKKYRGAKAVDSSCRNNGDDPFCRGNRLYSVTKKKLEAQYSDDDFVYDEMEEAYQNREELAEEEMR